MLLGEINYCDSTEAEDELDNEGKVPHDDDGFVFVHVLLELVILVRIASISAVVDKGKNIEEAHKEENKSV